MGKVRDSNMELLRIVALWMIVAYHIFAFCICYYYTDVNVIYKAIWLPLHIGVVLFVLISGYFRIKPTVKGAVRLLAYMFIYTVPLGLVYNHLSGGGLIGALKTLLFVSNSPFWFMRTYVCLYVAAPIINRLLDHSDTKQLVQIIAILSFIALYIGLAHFDDSLNSGKNVVNFSLIYIIGATIRKYHIWEKWSKWTYLRAYLGLNAIEMLVYIVLSGNIVGEGWFYVCFHYCSPVLIINAILILCFALNFSFKSKSINWLASSSIAIYLIHTIILYDVIAPASHMIYEYNSSAWFVIPMVLLLGSVVSIGCMLADKLLTPVWLLMGLLVPPIQRVTSWITIKSNALIEKI